MLPLRNLVLELNSSPSLFRVMSTVFLLLSTSILTAAQQPPPRGGEGRRGPPPEAFTACETSQQNDVCTVKSPHGTLTGTCQTDRRNDALVCVPQHMRRGQRSPQNGQSQEGTNTSPAQGSMREHTVTQSSGISNLYPASVPPIADSKIETRVKSGWRIIKANSISVHKTGVFPNPGNPNTITEQDFNIRVPVKPFKTDTASPVKVSGYALNGVSFDPGAGEFYKGDPSLGWQYEALSGAVALGIDENHAHVQPSGKYHYHGLPTGLMDGLNINPGEHSAQVGWAVDGFPIYALYGFNQMDGSGNIQKMQSSYRLKSGKRPSGADQPGGTYDGTFTADYIYVSGLGDLDECNGRVTVTPDFPNGTYAYYLTENYPVVPRCVMGTPDSASRRERR